VPLSIGSGELVVYSSQSTASTATGRLVILSVASGERTATDLAGLDPLAIVDGSLVYVTAAGVVMAVPFDEKRGRVTGTAIPIMSDAIVNQVSGVSRVAVSAAGTLATQTGSLTGHAVRVDLKGVPTPLIAEPRAYAYPRYSPDGLRLAMTVTSGSRSDVWLFEVSTGGSARVTTEGSVNERPEWTRDGKQVLYRSDRGGRSAIWWRAADLSGAATPLISHSRTDFYEGVVSPVDNYVAFQVDTSGADLYYRAITGDTLHRPIAATQFVETMPRISPDGKWIAYTTDESGANQVVVQPFPGGGAKTFVSTDGGSEPVWSRDGRRIFYRTPQKFYVATVRSDPAFTVVTREPLFDDTYLGSGLPHANYDVSPDGTHLVLIKAAERSQLLVVYNWTAELRARMAGAARQ
jgi:Tol biopolymer transport system component